MRIGMIGINHKSADLSLREKLAKACRRRFSPDQSLHPECCYVLLSTCNRTEIYFCSEDLSITHPYLLGILRKEIEEEFEHRIYSYFGSDCFLHLARVTSGMDSAIIGETEIQGQVKHAYEEAASFGTLSSELHFLFQKSLKIGKHVRAQNSLTRGLPTLEEAICNVGSALYGNLKTCRILFVGVSEINLKIYQSFKQRGFSDITFCNRTPKEGLRMLDWERLHEWVDYEVSIFGTKSPDFLVSKGSMEKHPPSQKLLIDLSVPRNVDPGLAHIRNIMLLNVDELNRVLDRKKRLKAAEIARIETHLIAKEVSKQVAIYQLKELQKVPNLALWA